MIRFKKTLPLFFLLGSVNAYSAKQHFIEFGYGVDTPKNNTVVAFIYDTISESGPGATVFNQTNSGSDSIEFVRNVFGPSVTVKQASVKYGPLPYQNYAVNASCKNLDLQSLDSRGLYITLHINMASMSIDCTTLKIKSPVV